MTRQHVGRTVTDYEELARYSVALRRAWAVRPHDRILDVGCGAGQTTRDRAEAS